VLQEILSTGRPSPGSLWSFAGEIPDRAGALRPLGRKDEPLDSGPFARFAPSPRQPIKLNWVRPIRGNVRRQVQGLLRRPLQRGLSRVGLRQLSHVTSMGTSARGLSGWPAVAVAAAVLGFQLFIPPRVGLANNGDFGKVAGHFGLHAPAEDELAFANLKWSIDAKYQWNSGFYSSETLLAAAAVGLNRLFTSTTEFDIRWIGLVHSLLFLLAIYLLQPLLAGITGALISASVILVFADFVYSSYFNSFYMDASAYVALMLTVVFFLRAAKWQRGRDSIGLILSAVFLVTSKTPHAVLGLWIVLLLAVFGRSLWLRNGRTLSLFSAGAIAAASIFGMKSAPTNYAADGCYTVIFFQVLPHSTDVNGDLRALGLDASYKKRIGTFAAEAGSGMADPSFVEGFRQRTSYARLGWYFFTHPSDAYMALETSLGEAGRVRPRMGNFDRTSGLPPYTQSDAFTLWSGFKRALFFRHGLRYLACFLLIGVAMCATATARRRSLPAVCVAGAYAFVGMATTALLTASLGDAAEVTRHHMVASALLDIELVLAFAFAIHLRPLRKGGATRTPTEHNGLPRSLGQRD
jgi:hypothetical protein